MVYILLTSGSTSAVRASAVRAVRLARIFLPLSGKHRLTSKEVLTRSRRNHRHFLWRLGLYQTNLDELKYTSWHPEL